MQQSSSKTYGRGTKSSFADSLVADPTWKWSDGFKQKFDVALTLWILLTFLPLIAVISLSLLAQGRPILIRHKRVGRGGKMFPYLKFRTMVINGDEVLQKNISEDIAARNEWIHSRKLKIDPRVTPLGCLLRKSGLDELPQLLNVLRGDMSLVGPRPIVLAEVAHYGMHIEKYYAVRPGLTGAWQVSGRSDISYNQRVSMDCNYVATRSLHRDMTIMLMTIRAVLRCKGSY